MSSYSTKSIQIFSLIIFILIAAGAAAAQSVETLPGYSGPLPFKLETGYISVGEDEEMQMFYYFIESESDPQKDPLMLWLTGGPGCSAFSGLLYEIGPLRFDVENFDGSLPNFTINNPYSWTKLASIIFIDSPVGTGFSYSTKPETYESTDDTSSAYYNYIFLKKWLSSHPTFLKNRLYIAGESYAGKIVPMVALLIAEGNEAGDEPRMPLQGYIVGNSRTDAEEDDNQIIPYAHRVALVSDEYFEFWRRSCDGRYENPDPENVQCTYALHLVNECTEMVNGGNILEPICKFISPRRNRFQWSSLLLVDDDPPHILLPSSTRKLSWCRNDNYLTSYVWANDESVQEALHVRKGTKSVWRRCNKTLAYDEDVKSVLKYHLLLSEKGYQALAYSGDHDLVLPYTCTLKWIRELNLTLDKPWRAWTVDSQVAGYTETYKNNQAYLMFATVKGAGHTAPEYKPKECFAMIQRWLSFYPL